MRNVPVSDKVANIVKKEVEKRNNSRKPGEPKYNQKILLEEIVINWKDNK